MMNGQKLASQKTKNMGGLLKGKIKKFFRLTRGLLAAKLMLTRGGTSTLGATQLRGRTHLFRGPTSRIKPT